MRKFNINDVVSSTFPPYLSNVKILGVDNTCDPITYLIRLSPSLWVTEATLTLVKKAPVNTSHAQPGDTIEIIWDHKDWLGKKFVVIDCPPDSFKDPRNAWFRRNEKSSPEYFTSGKYKIISRAGKTPNNKTTDKDVDTFLNEQKDDNLRSVFE